MSGLDPVVEKTMEKALDESNANTLHPDDRDRWMSLFPALVAAGYRWDIDDIYEWLNQHWPGPEGDRGMDHEDAIDVCAWAEMALAQRDPDPWGESIVQKIEADLAG